MKLLDLLDHSTAIWISSADPDQLRQIEISGITSDSRRVKPGWLFVAIKGLTFDGHDFIPDVIAKGAAAVVYQDSAKVEEVGEFVHIKVDNSQRSLGLLWAAWYDWPSRKMRIVGVTGTEGKTTTTNLIYQTLLHHRHKVALVSTINAYVGGRSVDTGLHVTNPEPEQLQKLLAEMVSTGTETVILEVTSHGIDQERIAGIDFYTAAVTNVTYDHMDYHKTFDHYLQTKARLLKNVKYSILNRDDANFQFLSFVASGKVLSFSRTEPADIEATGVGLNANGSEFELRYDGHQAKVSLPLPGLYNISNGLAAAGVCFSLGLTVAQVAAGLAAAKPLTGRFEEVGAGQPFKLVVDFAHTPNSLTAVLTAAKNLVGPGGRLITVFGSAGKRDASKRPLMGAAVGKLADITILTADDPRDESVENINNQISAGLDQVGVSLISADKLASTTTGPVYTSIIDRREGITKAINIAVAGDVVVLAGKGHEQSLAVGDQEIPWSDVEVARELLVAQLAD